MEATIGNLVDDFPARLIWSSKSTGCAWLKSGFTALCNINTFGLPWFATHFLAAHSVSSEHALHLRVYIMFHMACSENVEVSQILYHQMPWFIIIFSIWTHLMEHHDGSKSHFHQMSHHFPIGTQKNLGSIWLQPQLTKMARQERDEWRAFLEARPTVMEVQWVWKGWKTIGKP